MRKSSLAINHKSKLVAMLSMRRMSLALLSFQMPQVYVVLSEEIRQATQREKDIN